MTSFIEEYGCRRREEDNGIISNIWSLITSPVELAIGTLEFPKNLWLTTLELSGAIGWKYSLSRLIPLSPIKTT